MADPQASAHPVLNANTYLNYLTPSAASQFEFARDLYLATLGAYLWDILIGLPEDVALIRSGFHSTLYAYFLSRLSALTFVVLSVVVKTRTLSHCDATEYAVTGSWVIATASTSFLFFRRVWAIYEDNKIVRHTFFFLLLANTGLSVLVILGSRLKPLADTGYCVNAGVEHYVAAAAISRLIFDTCVFLAISYRLAITNVEEKIHWRLMFSRKASSRLVRAILTGGQQYYLMSVCSNLVVASLIFSHSVAPIYQAVFTAPDIALTSSMACRVFRNLRITAGRVDTGLSRVLFQNTDIFGAESMTDSTPTKSSSTGHRFYRRGEYDTSGGGGVHFPALGGTQTTLETQTTHSLSRTMSASTTKFSMTQVKPIVISSSSTTLMASTSSSKFPMPDSPV